MNRKQRKFVIILDMPQRSTQRQVREFILEAIHEKGLIKPFGEYTIDITSVHIENGD